MILKYMEDVVDSVENVSLMETLVSSFNYNKREEEGGRENMREKKLL